jgi:hypothetical protein
MLTYVDLCFPFGGTPSAEIAERLKEKAGLSFLRGEHDLCFRWSVHAELLERIERIHQALQGTGVVYRFTSVDEDEETNEFPGWPPVLTHQP